MTQRRGLRRPAKSEFRIRPAKRDDLDLLVRHRQGMWRDIGLFSPAELRGAAPKYRRWVRREQRARRFFGFIAETPDGSPTGSGAIWLQPVQPRPRPFDGPVSPYILSMYTERDFRGRGVATLLVAAMIDWARRRDYPRLTLHASRQGHPVYARIGFADSNEMRFNIPRIGRGRPASRIRR